MKKNNKSNVSQLTESLSSIDVQKMLLTRAKNSVLELAIELLEQDMEMLCGKKFSRKEDDLCHRGGNEVSSLFVDGAKYPIRKPRANKDGVEVQLPTFEKLRDRDLLDTQILERLMKGISSRNYEDVIASFSEKMGVSKSSVSRAFQRASKKHLEDLNSSDLSAHNFVAILIDGTGFGEQTLVVAMGITDDNQKVPLGLVAGNTENAGVVKDLLTSVVDRGFDFNTKRILVVVDGGKALKSAVRSLWGDNALIQRCWIHKLRNIKDYIPEVNHGQLWRRMKRMMGLNSYKMAQKEYKSLADWLYTINSDAKKSLDEAGEELLTVHSLEVTGTFKKVLTTTNLIESLIGVVKSKTGRVKNWEYHPKTKSKVERDKALRWAATAIQVHRNKMRRVYGGKKQMDSLMNTLNKVDTLKLSA